MEVIYTLPYVAYADGAIERIKLDAMHRWANEFTHALNVVTYASPKLKLRLSPKLDKGAG